MWVDTSPIDGSLYVVIGPVESAVRASLPAGTTLPTPTGRGQFTVTVARHASDSVVLLLGEKEAVTHVPWRALEEVPALLRGRWALIGSVYSTESTAGTLDAHLKKYVTRATAGWVAAVLEAAGVVIDRTRPSKVKLRGWPSPAWERCPTTCATLDPARGQESYPAPSRLGMCRGRCRCAGGQVRFVLPR